MPRSMTALAAVLAAVLLVAPACGDDDGGERGGTETEDEGDGY